MFRTVFVRTLVRFFFLNVELTVTLVPEMYVTLHNDVKYYHRRRESYFDFTSGST
jgi:hypothetical protein